MKFIVKAESFVDGILAAIDVASKGTVKGFFGVDKIGVEAAKDEIVVSAFGGQLGLTTKLSNATDTSLDYKFETAGSTTVSAKDLLTILRSFSPTEKVIVELKTEKITGDARELSVSMEADAEQFQTVPCFHAQIQVPIKTDKYAKELKIDKGVFVAGIEKVMYATGFETDRPEFLAVVLKASKEKLRFSAGTGARHVIYEIEGKNIVDATSEISIFMPKNHMSAMIKSIKGARGESVVIKETTKSPSEKDVVFHISVECGILDFILVGLDPSNKWPDESKVLGLDYPCKMTIQAGELALASKGTAATFNEQVKQEERAHKAIVEIDVAKKVVVVKTKEYMKSARKVLLKDIVDTSGNNNISFACISSYLAELSERADKNEYIQMEMIEAKKPIVVYFYAAEKVSDGSTLKNVNKAKGYSEKFITFFGTYGA